MTSVTNQTISRQTGFFFKKRVKTENLETKTLSNVGFLQHSFHKLKFSNSCNIFHTVSVASVLHFHQNGGKKKSAQLFSHVFNPAAMAVRNAPSYKNPKVNDQPMYCL